MITEIRSSQTVIIGVVADTHVPDRVNSLHPKLLKGLAAFHVDLIFHAGDIATKRIIDELETVAPVYGVSGNRDLFLRNSLSHSRYFLINGIRILLTHGHFTPGEYWRDKVASLFRGYQLDRYMKRLLLEDDLADVYVFGHSHHSENLRDGNHLFFNPGSTSFGSPGDPGLSFGLIKIAPDGLIDSQIISLEGAEVKCGRWHTGEKY